jgi:hypothetical protein
MYALGSLMPVVSLCGKGQIVSIVHPPADFFKEPIITTDEESLIYRGK